MFTTGRVRLIFRLAFLFAVICSVLIVPLYLSDVVLGVYLNVAKRVAEKFNMPYIERIVRWPLNLDPRILIHESYSKSIPQLKLTVSQASLDTLDKISNQAVERGFLSKKINIPVHGYLLAGNEQLAIELKLHGSTKGNFKGVKKSYSIKSIPETTGPHSISFNLINPKQHNYLAPKLGNMIARKLHLLCNEQMLVHLFINGKSRGLYWKEEKIDQAFVKHSGIDGQLIKLNDNWIENTPVACNFGLQAISGLKKSCNKKGDYARLQYAGMVSAAEREDIKALSAFFDPGYMGRFEAFRCLFGVCHDLMWENLKLIYNESDQKFYPVVRVEGDLNKVAFYGGSLLHSYNNYRFLDLSKDVVMRAFILLNNHPEFRLKKFAAFREITEHFQEWTGELFDTTALIAKAMHFDPYDPHSVREKAILFKQYAETLRHNVQLMSEQIKTPVLYVNIFRTSDSVRVECIPDAEIPVKLKEFGVITDQAKENVIWYRVQGMRPATISKEGERLQQQEQFPGNIIMPVFGSDGCLKKTVYTYTICLREDSFDAVQYRIKAINCIDGAQLMGRQINVGVASAMK